jgi:3-oxoacyl-[acyl-carrier-protein] synthase I
MAGAYIRGVGLNCALGDDPERCVSAMQQMQVRPIQLQLDDFNEPLGMPYYRIPDTADLFDSTRFQHLLPPVVRMAVQQAGLSAAEIRRLPLFIGSSCFSVGLSESQYAVELDRDPATAMPMPLCGGYQLIAGIVQQQLGMQGDCYTYNTACTASANAILGALRTIALGWYRHALVIGAELANRTTLAGFSGLQIVAEKLKPFDANRQGLVLGEGISAVLLSADAGPDNRLQITGGASNTDTWSVTTANPDGNSVAAVLAQALTVAQIEPRQVQGIKAHGTATPMGDTAEAIGIRQVFSRPPPVSALKPFIGHTLGACGINELALFAGALRRGFVPASPGFEMPDSALGLVPITRPGAAPDGHYLLNHFGFGGNNAVLVLKKTAS